jgi:hypothetical protein
MQYSRANKFLRLAYFDEQFISIHSIVSLIQEFEDQDLMDMGVDTPEINETFEEAYLDPNLKMPLPLVLTMGGLTILTAKQLIWGRSAFAVSPESMIVLAGLSLLQYLNWRKSQKDIEQKKMAD